MGHDGPGHIAIAQEQPTLRALKLFHGKRGAGPERRVQGPLRAGHDRAAARRPPTARSSSSSPRASRSPARRSGSATPTAACGSRSPPAEFFERWCARGPDAPRRARRRPSSRARCARVATLLGLEYARGGLSMERVCFQLQVRAERLDEYRARHRAVWPEMLDALSAAGWSNYSLFLRRRRAADRLPRDRGLRRAAWRRWRRPTSTRAGRREMAPFFDPGQRLDTDAPRGGVPP